MGVFIGCKLNGEDPPGVTGRQQRYEGIGYGDIYHRAQGNTGIECTGTRGTIGPTGCTGSMGITGSQGYSTGCHGSTGPTYYGYPATGSGGVDIGVTGSPPPEEGNMSAINKKKRTLMEKWGMGGMPSKSMPSKRDEEPVELELPPEAYEMHSSTEEESLLSPSQLSTAPRSLSRPINRKMVPYDFGKKNG